MKEKFEKKETIVFRCEVEKVPLSQPKGGIKVYYGPRQDEKTGAETHGDEIVLSRTDFEAEMAEGKNGLTGKPLSGLFNHFTLKDAPDDIAKKYNDFMSRDVTFNEVARMHPTNIRLLGEMCRIEDYDTKKIEVLVKDIAKQMGLDMKPIADGMTAEEEKKLRQEARKAGIGNWHNMKIENIKKKLEELKEA
jgi:hypothetical protein